MVPPPAPSVRTLQHRRADVLAGDLALGGLEHAAVDDDADVGRWCRPCRR